ncbi:beta-ketoacyl synthase N-terminal-like domain-containing protein [Parapedobacter deserti]|uniref:Beta-ketoacyl synthase N-terminal-like domain-containing protein n=1 Tax=Parapedobacter deserti TaxID=1912957 RepID=A0ABV7JQ52_9SPHI
MIKPIYIHGSGCVSIQRTVDADYFFEDVQAYTQNVVPVVDPDYKTLIPASQLRRMNKSMRMAIFASKLALKDAGTTAIDAVITGTGLGCLRDSERFVEALMEEEGQLLNPTPFIQSTHNMAAASIALALGCKGYNMTYVNNANSFESALLDTMVYLAEHPQQTTLLGGVDELGVRSSQFWDLANYLKRETPSIPIPLKASAATVGEIAAEGAAFFVVSRQPGPQPYGKVTATATCLETTDAKAFVGGVLEQEGLDTRAIDAVIMGCNGDTRHDPLYQGVSEALFADTAQLAFKHILGEYDTVVASALFLALGIFRHQRIPRLLRLNDIPPRSLQRILIYTQRRGKNHSVILVER